MVITLVGLAHNLAFKKGDGMMKKRRLLRIFSYAAGTVMLAATVVQAQVFVVSRGGVELSCVLQDAPGPGYSAVKWVLRTTDPDARIVTFENLRIDGAVVQTWLSGPLGEPTAKGAPQAGPTYDESWIPFDSHVLIEESMVGGSAGGGYQGIDETNDSSIGAIPGRMSLE